MVEDVAKQKDNIRELSAELTAAEATRAKLVQELHAQVSAAPVLLDISSILDGKAEDIPISVDSLLKPQSDYKLEPEE
eukprot:844346-Pyramimonas_sp.AAC.1